MNRAIGVFGVATIIAMTIQTSVQGQGFINDQIVKPIQDNVVNPVSDGAAQLDPGKLLPKPPQQSVTIIDDGWSSKYFIQPDGSILESVDGGPYRIKPGVRAKEQINWDTGVFAWAYQGASNSPLPVPSRNLRVTWREPYLDPNTGVLYVYRFVGPARREQRTFPGGTLGNDGYYYTQYDPADGSGRRWIKASLPYNGANSAPAGTYSQNLPQQQLTPEGRAAAGIIAIIRAATANER